MRRLSNLAFKYSAYCVRSLLVSPGCFDLTLVCRRRSTADDNPARKLDKLVRWVYIPWNTEYHSTCLTRSLQVAGTVIVMNCLANPHQTSKLALDLFYIGIGVLCTTYIATVCWIASGERISRRIRE
jgi:hypothetical protein